MFEELKSIAGLNRRHVGKQPPLVAKVVLHFDKRPIVHHLWIKRNIFVLKIINVILFLYIMLKFKFSKPPVDKPTTTSLDIIEVAP